MKIPITFQYEGKEYKGEFFGVGIPAFTLSIDKCYQGQLVYNKEKDWYWGGYLDRFEGMEEIFARVVIAWHEGE